METILSSDLTIKYKVSESKLDKKKCAGLIGRL